MAYSGWQRGSKMNDGNTYFYSAKTNGFYPLALKHDVYDPSGTWPDDAVELTYEEYSKYLGQPPEGKTVGAGEDGHPSWVDMPPPSKEDLLLQAIDKKSSLMAVASAKIAPLQDAVDLDMATPQEVAALKAWKQYRVLLNRVDPAAPQWPEVPKS